MLIELLLD